MDIPIHKEQTAKSIYKITIYFNGNKEPIEYLVGKEIDDLSVVELNKWVKRKHRSHTYYLVNWLPVNL